MQAGAVTGYIDVAQLTLYAFWIFFAGLIFYLRREDKREGYPLLGDRTGQPTTEGFPPMPRPKTFILPNGGTQISPRPFVADGVALNAEPTAMWPGAPLQPLGDPMLAAVGPGAFVMRADTPDLTLETEEARVVPLRVATDHYMDPEGPDPRTMEVVGADGVSVGPVVDLWIDRAETTIRYIEVTLASGASVLVPMPLARVDATNGRVVVRSIYSAQFAGVPLRALPDSVTLREEDRISAYFAGGTLFADASRAEPLL